MQAIAGPDAAISLLLAGVLLIYAEFNRPGTILPGACGALLVLLAFHSLAALPLHPLAVAGTVAALPLLYCSGQRRLLALPGAALLVLCMLRLTPGLHPGLIAAESTIFSAITLLAARITYRARHNKFRVGTASTVGKRALTVTALSPGGQVEVFGQLWQATLRDPAARLAARQPVQVHSIQEHLLLVEPLTE